ALAATCTRRQRAHQVPEGPAICILSFQWFIKFSRDETPVGRGLAFAPGDVATGIRAITARRSLLPTSQARTSVSPPRGELTRRRKAPTGDVRGFHVPQMKHV